MYHHLKKKCKTVSSLFSTHFSKPINQKKKKRRIENLFRRLFNTLCNFNNSFLLNRKETRLSFLPVKNNPKPWTVFLLPYQRENYTIREEEFFSREIYQDFSESESPQRFKTIDSFFASLSKSRREISRATFTLLAKFPPFSSPLPRRHCPWKEKESVEVHSARCSR